MVKLEVDCQGRLAEVEIHGSGDDVFLVGAAVPMTWTRPTAQVLAARGWRVTNFDYGSDHPSPEPRSSLEQIPDVVAVMDAVGVDSGVVVGLSRGAITAYGLAASRPERARGLVLALPVSGFAESLETTDSPTPSGEDGDPDPDLMLAQVFSSDFLADNRQTAVGLLTTSPGSVTRIDRRNETPFPAGLTVGCPMLVIEGSEDAIVESSHPARYLEATPDARHVLVSGARHGWPLEAPEVFGGMIEEFARSVY